MGYGEVSLGSVAIQGGKAMVSRTETKVEIRVLLSLDRDQYQTLTTVFPARYDTYHKT